MSVIDAFGCLRLEVAPPLGPLVHVLQRLDELAVLDELGRGHVALRVREQGSLPTCWQAASGSGKTRPRAKYWGSLVATGAAMAAGQKLSVKTATAAVRSRIRISVSPVR